jgi:stearoyl-CoA desaturase (delta-9 desaturase)
VLEFLDSGLLDAAWWQILLYALVCMHLTIVAVTLYLHRAQAHRALELHALPAHFFRFWLWLTTGMSTRAWVAVHRKHHAHCDRAEDPHSPQVHGLRKVLLQGAELYRAEARNVQTLARYGAGAPDDWLERRVYARLSWQGVGLLLVLNVALFGAIGLSVWAVQMAWIPLAAAGVINGLGHYWGYRNFEVPDASTNLSPWGLVIGGEELHNNHHTYPTSAKFSVRPGEFDLGWLYIRALQALGLARARPVPLRLRQGPACAQVDERTLGAVVACRYEVLARYARHMRAVCRAEAQRLRQQPAPDWARIAALKFARKQLGRNEQRGSLLERECLAQALQSSPALARLAAMREELCALWTKRQATQAELVADLQTWCARAEASGCTALGQMAQWLRLARC